MKQQLQARKTTTKKTQKAAAFIVNCSARKTKTEVNK